MPFLSVNGLDYRYTLAGTGPGLLLLHGFTGSLESWSPHIPCLARHFSTVVVDLPGHGRTRAPADPSRYGHAPVSADLVTLMARLGYPEFNLLGYSMGGRLSLSLAMQYPQHLRALILESASPGLSDAGERAARRQQDEALAQRIERDGVASFVDFWERLPLFASQRSLPAERRESLRELRLGNRPSGLAASLRGAGTSAQPSHWPHLLQLNIPTLLLSGALDRKFCEIARSMVASNPGFQWHQFAAAGHCINLELPQRFRQIVLDFLLNQE